LQSYSVSHRQQKVEENLGSPATRQGCVIAVRPRRHINYKRKRFLRFSNTI